MVKAPLILLTTINAKWIHPSLALRLLKANLGDLEERCEILEFALRQPLSEKIAPILAARPRILGFSVSIWNHTATLELLEALDARWREEAASGAEPPGDGTSADGAAGSCPRPLVVLGGPEASFLPDDAQIFRYAGFVIRGEGELAFRELCRQVVGGGGNGRGKFIDAPPVDPGRIRSGYRLYTGEDLRRKLIYVEASRGCPYGCEFCLSAVRVGVPAGGDTGTADTIARNARVPAEAKVRYFPLEPFLEEMEGLINRGVRTFKFLDRTFNLDIPRARRIMEFFLERMSPAQCLHVEMVPSRFPPELRETLSRFRAGTLRLEIGIQTFNPETGALIKRPGNPGREIETLEFLRRKTEAIIHADLIAGLPGEDLASFGDGFDRLWRALSADPPPGGFPAAAEIQLGILKCLPGAPIARHTESCGMRYSRRPPYEVMETSALPADALDRIKNFARFWERIVNRGNFPDLAPALFPAGEPVFRRFMELSDRLMKRFGRNWGIDRKALRQALEEEGGSSRQDAAAAAGRINLAGQREISEK
jgi:hypothetical protein